MDNVDNLLAAIAKTEAMLELVDAALQYVNAGGRNEEAYERMYKALVVMGCIKETEICPCCGKEK